ncbi:acyl carrier protein [Bradyrhizobium sp. CCGUVB4N]|uniref:acyl carrier protein n=1 Tax=Bradyrhizobium sp. CCGUVB4N TaxID=2949631 RepID=UPI0020B373B8|nr:acyl carrier protein [Bradyrhizobium sp. CCGUVB4N]MCP3381416.1 acyl carrier protein [Bradyrhizobium sp. CCGUVB4N]
MKNTLNFVGDGDDVDVIFDVERTFGIKLTDAEAEQTRTVGQLYDLIELKRPNAGTRTQACLSQMAFYRLRRALKIMGIAGEITPQTPISILEQIEPRSIAPKWRRLAQNSGLDLPSLETSFQCSERVVRWRAPFVWGTLMCLWMAFGIPWDYRLFMLMAGALCVDISLGCLGWLIFRTIPRRILTIGELAREAAGVSFAKLIIENKESAPPDRWFALTAILRAITGHTVAITRQTTFFAKHATHDFAL